MKTMTKKLTKTLIAGVIGSSMAMPAMAALEGASPFKIAVIKDAVGSSLINQGHYMDAITAISSDDAADEMPTSFEQAMGLCVANLKMARYSDAESACTTAISSLDDTAINGGKKNYLRSLAYSNRAIVRHLADNPYGAVNDFSLALKSSPNKLVYSNLAKLETIK